MNFDFGIITIVLWLLVIYFITSNLLFLVQVVFAFRHTISEKKHASELPQSFLQVQKQKLSVLIPCFNESRVIVNNALAVLRNTYPELEVIIINDGSKDQTFELLKNTFDLTSDSDHGSFQVYRSGQFNNLLVLDQKNVGKSQSLNNALQICSGSLVATIDADTSVTDDSFLKCVHYMQANPDCMVLGGIVRVMNGARISGGQVSQGRLPRSFLPLFQTIEYIRSFFGGRMGLEAIGGSALVPGAFSIFRKEALLCIGGFDPNSATEDFEIVIRLKQEFTNQKKACEIHMISSPVCWTEVPENFRDLFRQRVRWQRGLLQTLWKHRSLIGNPLAGRLGIFTLPYLLVFEGLAPVVELIGYVVISIAYFHKLISPQSLGLFIVIGTVFYSLLTIVTVHLEEKYYAKHFSKKSVFIFFLYSFLENFGYRQFIFLARLKGTLSIFSSKQLWGEHERRNAGIKTRLNQSENLGLALFAVSIVLATFFILKTELPAHFSPPSKIKALQSLMQQRDEELARGDLNKALEDTETLHRLVPNNIVYLRELAKLRQQTGRFEEAAFALEELLKSSSDYEDVCPTLGSNYLSAGKNEKAFEAFQLCYKMLPKNTDVIFFLAREFERRKNYNRALELYQSGTELSKNYTDMTDGLARVKARVPPLPNRPPDVQKTGP